MGVNTRKGSDMKHWDMEKKKANDWIKDHYPNGEATVMCDGRTFVEWDQMLDMMAKYAKSI